MNLSLQIDLPVRFIPEQPMTDSELMRFCAANETLRVEREPNGEILVMTPAGWNTSKMNQRIGRILDEWAEHDGRGYVTDSSGGYNLPDGSMRSPDAAWVARRRIDALTAEQRASFAPVCPDFILEIRSPSDSLRELKEKMEQWIANGVEVAWLVDPIDRAVTVYRPGAEPECHVNPNSVQGSGPVAGFELVLARVWG